jgi:short subunit dehydrogenase-like uncharacterized protein
MSQWLRPLLRQQWLQDYLKTQVDKRVKGPGAADRDKWPVHVWGEARNAAGDKVTARIVTANGYSVTCDAPPMIIQHLMEHDIPAGSNTPANLFGKDFVCTVPGSSSIEFS